MTDHLPECIHHEGLQHTSFCICDRLRACEQRVLDEVLPDVRYAAYAAGVQAARDAVAVLLPPDYEMNWCAAIDAIDALKGERP